MKPCVCLPYSVALFTIFTTSVISKSIYDSRSDSRDDELAQYPVKRKINVEQPFFVAAHEEQPDLLYTDSNLQDLSRYHRVEQQPSFEASDAGSRIEKQLDLGKTSLDKRADRLSKRDLRRRDDGYGIVYGNGRPIGILEPFPQSYEFSPLTSGEANEEIEPQMNPRRSVIDVGYPNDPLMSMARLSGENLENSETNLQDSAKFADDKYPLILTDFKINNRLNNLNSFKRDSKETADKDIKMKNRNSSSAKRDTAETTSNQKEAQNNKVELKAKIPSEVKRSAAGGITNEKIAELKLALNLIQNPGPSDKVEEIEDNLKDILSDMGLIDGEDKSSIESAKNKRNIVIQDDAAVKRDIDEEDENLEEGANKIQLVRALHDAPSVDRSKREDKKEAKNEIKDENVVDLSQPKLDEQDAASNNLVKINEDSSVKAGLKSESSEESLDKEDVKRDADRIDVANYQSEGEAFLRSKRQESSDIMKGLEKSGDLTVSGNKSPLASSGNDAEVDKKRSKDSSSTAPSAGLEKNKRQQNDMEYQQQLEQNIQAKIDEIKEQVKREIATLKATDTAVKDRRKRDIINTLVEEETSAVDPAQHPEEELTPLVRQRRHLQSLQARKRIKRGLPDFSNLNDIDSGDYLDLTGEKQREQRETITDYQVDPQENKYLPVNLENAQKIKDGLVAAENALNVNEQAEAQQSKNVKVEERSVDDSMSQSVHVAEKKLPDAIDAEKQDNAVQLVAAQPEEQRSAKENHQKETDSSGSDLTDSKDETGKRSVAETSEKPKPTPTENQKDEDKRDVEDGAAANNEAVDLENSGLNLDLQKSKEEVNMQEVSRRRRDVDEEIMRKNRRKRAESVMPYAKSAFFPYRAEDDDGNDEGDEFDDDTLDERLNLQKRETDYGKNRRSIDYQDYGRVSDTNRPDEKRSLANRYVASMNSDVYENPSNYLYSPGTYVRKKRQNFDQLVALHGGGPMLHHLAAVRDRNIQQMDEDNFRRKRNFKHGQNAGNQITKEQPQNIADLSDTDLFGALPQNYEGQLARFKRVKRQQPIASSTVKPYQT